MKSQCITIRELPDYLNSAEFQNSNIIPISHQRGLAQSKNPRAEAEDVALILLKENDQLMGYIGLLPDTIYLRDQARHVGWMSCLWVSPDARGKGIATKLLNKAFEVWNNRLVVTEFTAPAKRLYDKSNFFDDLTINHGIRAYLRLNLAVLLPKKDPRYLKVRFLLKIVDATFNLFNAMRLFFYKKRELDIRVEEIREVDEAIWKWIKQFQKEELFRRTKIDLNWLLKNPWLNNTSEAEKDARRYHFSVYEKRFRFVPLKIYYKEKIAGFVILAQRGDALKLPYAYFEKEYTDTIAEVLKSYMLDNNCSTLTIYNKPLNNSFLKNKSPFFIIRPFKRHYLIAKSFDWTNQNQPATLQDGDGDCAFT